MNDCQRARTRAQSLLPANSTELERLAAAEGLTVEGATQQIAEAAARADELLQAVRRIRLAGKAATRDAGDDDDFMKIAQSYFARLELMLPKT